MEKASTQMSARMATLRMMSPRMVGARGAAEWGRVSGARPCFLAAARGAGTPMTVWPPSSGSSPRRRASAVR